MPRIGQMICALKLLLFLYVKEQVVYILISQF